MLTKYIYLIWYVYLQRFYKYHELIYQRQLENQDSKQGGEDDKIPYWRIFKQASPQLFNVFFVFFVTLTIFPAVHSGITYFFKQTIVYNYL